MPVKYGNLSITNQILWIKSEDLLDYKEEIYKMSVVIVSTETIKVKSKNDLVAFLVKLQFFNYGASKIWGPFNYQSNLMN